MRLKVNLYQVVLLKNKFNNIIILLCMSSLRLAVIEKKRSACGAYVMYTSVPLLT